MNPDSPIGLSPLLQRRVLADSQMEAARLVSLESEFTATPVVKSLEILEHVAPKIKDDPYFLRFRASGVFDEPGFIQKKDGRAARAFEIDGKISYFTSDHTLLGDCEFITRSFKLT